MTVQYQQYNPQADPRQYFAQGLQNLVAGLNQQTESKRFGQALGGVDPEAGFLQAISQMLTGGATPKQAMGVGSMAQKSGAGRLGTLPGWWAFATPKQQQAYMDRVGGPLVQLGDRNLTPEQRVAKAQKGFKEEMADAPLSAPQLEGHGEAMNVRLEKAKRVWYKRAGRDNYPESELFKQWQIFTGMHKFKNDTQRKQVWNVWKNKIKNRAAEGWFGKETDFDPTDPKWRKAIGLSKEEDGAGTSSTKEQSAHRSIYDAWDQFPRELQDKIRIAEQQGKTYRELIETDEVAGILKKIVK